MHRMRLGFVLTISFLFSLVSGCISAHKKPYRNDPLLGIKKSDKNQIPPQGISLFLPEPTAPIRPNWQSE
jgi:hypothetical protein